MSIPVSRDPHEPAHSALPAGQDRTEMSAASRGDLGHPSWCERQHAADFPAHALDVGGVEVGERELAVSLYQYGTDQPGQVWFCEVDHANTSVIELSAEQAMTLGRALIQAASLLDGQLPVDGLLTFDDQVDLLTGRLDRVLAERRLRGAR